MGFPRPTPSRWDFLTPSCQELINPQRAWTLIWPKRCRQKTRRCARLQGEAESMAMRQWLFPLARHAAEYSNIAYIWEVNPGEGPLFPANVTAASARTLENDYTSSTRVFQDQTRTHTALKNQLYRRYPTEYCTGLIKTGIGIATVPLLEMYTHL